MRIGQFRTRIKVPLGKDRSPYCRMRPSTDPVLPLVPHLGGSMPFLALLIQRMVVAPEYALEFTALALVIRMNPLPTKHGHSYDEGLQVFQA